MLTFLLWKGERGNQHRRLACFHWWRAGEGSKGHVAGGESQNPIVPFSFLFINRKSRQTGHYGETWKHPIPFRPRSVESSCAICTEIVRETWSKPGEEMKIANCIGIEEESAQWQKDQCQSETSWKSNLFEFQCLFFFSGMPLREQGAREESGLWWC